MSSTLPCFAADSRAYAVNSPLVTRIAPVAPAKRGTWYHVQAVRNVDADVARIYINGRLDASGTDSTTGSWETTGQYPLIAKYDAATDEFFAGVIDEVKVYNYARSASQVGSSVDEAPEAPKVAS